MRQVDRASEIPRSFVPNRFSKFRNPGLRSLSVFRSLVLTVALLIAFSVSLLGLVSSSRFWLSGFEFLSLSASWSLCLFARSSPLFSFLFFGSSVSLLLGLYMSLCSVFFALFVSGSWSFGLSLFLVIGLSISLPFIFALLVYGSQSIGISVCLVYRFLCSVFFALHVSAVFVPLHCLLRSYRFCHLR